MTEQSNILLERREADGLEVVVSFAPLMDMVVLNCRRSGEMAATSVPSDSVLDAFTHPMCYLGAAQVELLYPRGQ